MILAFDPGRTTGWAMVDLDETVIKTGTIKYEDMEIQVPALQKVSYKYLVCEYVVPTGINVHSMVLQDVSETFRRAFPKALWVRSGLWKPVMAPHRRLVIGKYKTRHEGDAVLLAIYALRHRKKALAEQVA